MTKRKIKGRIKEHQNDIKFGKFNIALAELIKKEILKIDFGNVREITQYSNPKYALLREAFEISRDAGACNHVEHAKIHPIWRSLLGDSLDQPTNKKKDMTAGRGSAANDEEESLRKISYDFFWGGGFIC